VFIEAARNSQTLRQFINAVKNLKDLNERRGRRRNNSTAQIANYQELLLKKDQYIEVLKKQVADLQEENEQLKARLAELEDDENTDQDEVFPAVQEF
jgi:septal ring factor EnvC (AmiA/AmiB activator)